MKYLDHHIDNLMTPTGGHQVDTMGNDNSLENNENIEVGGKFGKKLY